MARTVKPKKKIQKIKGTKKVKAFYNNLGGHLIDPPDVCRNKKTATDESKWADLAMCFSVCKEQCERYKWFCKADRQERNEEWKRCGVKQIVF